MKLAIQGHPTQDKEVIKLLEMLGGVNPFLNKIGNKESVCYYISEDTATKYISWDYIGPEEIEKYKIFTLEEFLEKYPFKVGDKVERNIDYVSCFINDMRWNCDRNCVEYHLCSLYGNDAYGWHIAECFNKDCPDNTHKNMEERKYSDLRLDVDQDDKLATEVTIDSDKITPPKNYLIGKITKVDNGMLVEFVKKQPQYPKTYEECCDVIYGSVTNTYGNCVIKINDGYKSSLIQSFQRLIFYRDAYWKIAGEQMGLNDPWKPDWKDKEQIKFVIIVQKENIQRYEYIFEHKILAFPTEEMRDVFYKNFKKLIEECKELL